MRIDAAQILRHNRPSLPAEAWPGLIAQVLHTGDRILAAKLPIMPAAFKVAILATTHVSLPHYSQAATVIGHCIGFARGGRAPGASCVVGYGSVTQNLDSAG